MNTDKNIFLVILGVLRALVVSFFLFFWMGNRMNPYPSPI